MARFARNILLSFVFSVVLAVPFSSVAHAQTSVASGYQDILAQGIIFAQICPSAAVPDVQDTCTCRATGQCSLGDIMQIFVNISVVILGLSGSLVLVMFVYGGLMWILSHGNEKMLTEGKETMTHAVIGLFIIFGAYAFVNFIIAGLIGKAPQSTIEGTVNSATGASTK
jgi:hypothetical protein